MARPTTYNIELCKEICDEVANGFNIKTVLASKPEYPDFSTWCNWKRDNDELFHLYTRAIQDKAESVDEEIDFIMSEVQHKNMESHVGRLLIDTLKWKAGKYYPKMFGDKVDITSQGEKISNAPDLSKLSKETLQNLAEAYDDEKDD